MCGIVGYVGTRPVVDLLLRGLGQLEYRGYDSTGIAVERTGESGKIEILKSEGKLENVARLAKELGREAKAATCGMGHTRWATHGKPTTQNAHPHRTGHVVLVHNGIIENYPEIKKEMAAKGHHPVSETDSELFGFLVLEEMKAGKKLRPAVTAAFRKIEGSCSVVVMSDLEPGTVVGVRNGTPMVAGADPEGGGILASDAQPLLDFTKDVVFLEDGVAVEITGAGLKFYEFATDREVRPATTHLDWTVENMEKGGYPTFMRKEIFEQPTAIVDTLNATLDRAKTEAFPLANHRASQLLLAAEEIVFVACGTSWHSALLGKYWIERYARIPVAVELASEFRYRDPVLKPKTLVIGITQSGETADTLAVVKEMKKRGVPTAAITNVRGSSISREADGTFFTAAGPEVGVASTKAFMAQLATLLCFAGARSKVGPQAAGIDPKVSEKLFHDTIALPHAIQTYLGDENGVAKQAKAVAEALQDAKGFFFIGRGYSFPMALEGALKLKELAYVYAEGYAAGELKHGPIAMIEEGMVVVVLAPKDSWRDKTVSNLEEVKARGARIVSVGQADDTHLRSLSDYWIPLPALGDEALLPFAMAPVVQLLAYEIALRKGTNIDKPRNLAKSVTVE